MKSKQTIRRAWSDAYYFCCRARQPWNNWVDEISPPVSFILHLAGWMAVGGTRQAGSVVVTSNISISLIWTTGNVSLARGINSKVCLIVRLFVVERHHWALLVSDCLDLGDVLRNIQHLYVLIIIIIVIGPLGRTVFITLPRTFKIPNDLG